jgi:hypothetical protein
MATQVVDKSFIDAVANEIACGVDAAVEGWIAEIEAVLQHPLLSDDDKLFSMSELVARYKYATGKAELRRRIN